MNRAKQLFQSTMIVIIFWGLGKLTGLLRTRLVGVAFGTGVAYDAFTAANQLPEVFVTVISGGSLAAAFIPVYSAYLMRQHDGDRQQLANATMTLVVVVLGGISVIGWLLSPWLARVVLVPEFPVEQQQMTARLMQIILIQTMFVGIGGVLSSILNAHKHFALPALTTIALDIGYVAGLYLFVPQLGINGLAWGAVIGGLLHIVIQIPALRRYHYRYRPNWHFQTTGMREIIQLMGPRVVTLGVIQVADLFIIRLTSGLPTGSTSAYFYGYVLMQLPETLLGTAVALVVFPTMAERFNDGDLKTLKTLAANSLRIIWTLTIPAAAGLVLLGEPAIRFFLEGGAFDANSTRLVYSVLIAFSIRLVSEATLEIVARLFYAQHNTRTPMYAYLGWLVINISLAYMFVDSLGIFGLAFASSIAFTILSALLYLLNRRVIGPLPERQLLISAGRAIISTIGMSLLILGFGRLDISPFLFLGLSAVSGVGCYFGLSFVLGGREIPQLLQLIRQKE